MARMGAMATALRDGDDGEVADSDVDVQSIRRWMGDGDESSQPSLQPSGSKIEIPSEECFSTSANVTRDENNLVERW